MNIKRLVSVLGCVVAASTVPAAVKAAAAYPEASVQDDKRVAKWQKRHEAVKVDGRAQKIYDHFRDELFACQSPQAVELTLRGINIMLVIGDVYKEIGEIIVCNSVVGHLSFLQNELEWAMQSAREMRAMNAQKYMTIMDYIIKTKI